MTINVTINMPDKCEYKGRVSFWDRDKPGDDWRDSGIADRYLSQGEVATIAVWDTRGLTISEHYGAIPSN